MTVYDGLDYKEFLRTWVLERPGGGRGEYSRIAQFLGVSTTLVSQVVNGDKHFSLELANDLCEHLALGDKESDQFLLLIEYARAGTFRYQQRLKKRIEAAQKVALKVGERVRKDRELTETQSAIYYSSWAYTGVFNLIATNPKMTTDEIAARLKLPRNQVSRVLTFLLDTGILVDKDGLLDVGIQRTHLSSDSPLVVKHHQNWRVQAFNKMNFAADEDLFYTGPMSMSEEVAQRVRQELPALIAKIVEWVGPSPSEVVRCLNIDWFEF